MKYFVLWSGGVDSTYLIQKLLGDGHQVTTGYIELINNTAQTKRELDAIKMIAPQFSAKFGTKFQYKGVISKHELVVFSDNVELRQPLVWLGAFSSIGQDIDRFAIGYILNDCAISYLEDFHTIARAYGGFFKKPIHMEFPLIKMDKSTVYNALDIEIKPHVTWCEDPEYVNCGRCVSCKRMIDAYCLREEDTHFNKWKYEKHDGVLVKEREPLTINYEFNFDPPIPDNVVKLEKVAS